MYFYSSFNKQKEIDCIIMCNYDIEVRNKVWNNISDMVEELTAIPILLNNRKIVEEDLEIMWRMIG